jgi:hypothetical protein
MHAYRTSMLYGVYKALASYVPGGTAAVAWGNMAYVLMQFEVTILHKFTLVYVYIYYY